MRIKYHFWINSWKNYNRFGRSLAEMFERKIRIGTRTSYKVTISNSSVPPGKVTARITEVVRDDYDVTILVRLYEAFILLVAGVFSHLGLLNGRSVESFTILRLRASVRRCFSTDILSGEM